MEVRTDQALIADKEKLSSTVAHFWNKISSAWKIIWGPHIHHGFYEKNKNMTPLEAQENLIEKLTELLNISANAAILDVGCGMGGSSIYLAKKYDAAVTGITLSQKQVEIAAQQSLIEQVKQVNFKIEDALSMQSIESNSFDIVWSLESCEQFFDKNAFLKQAFRVLKPGGKLMLATWCSDQDVYAGKLAKQYQKLCYAFDLPYMPTMKSYRQFLLEKNFIVQHALDWSASVSQSWDIGITLANSYHFFQLFKWSGFRGLRFLKQLKLMQKAFHEKRVMYGVFVAAKPD